MKTPCVWIAAAFLAFAGGAVDAQAPSAPAGVSQPASVPRWNGLWIAEGAQPGIDGFARQSEEFVDSLVGIEAPWNEEGEARFSAMIASQGNRKSDGWGYPMMMGGSAPLQFIITPEETVILNMYREVRHVYTDGRPHPPEEDRWPTTWGDSIGRWEGDTLIIDTVGVRNPQDYFFLGPPLSEKAHYVERLRMAAPDRIESEVTIEDPVTLKGPWTVTIVYRPAEGMDRLVHDDLSNDRSGFDGEVFTISATPEAAAATSQAAAPPPPPPVQRTQIELTAAELDRFVGRYETPPVGVTTIRREQAGLTISAPGQPTLAIYPEAPLVFFSRILDFQMQFTTDAAGQVTGFVFNPSGGQAPMTGKRLATP